MRTYGATLAAHIAARKPMHLRHLVWITARNRGTGAPETMGLWTGDDTRVFTIDAVSRTYYGAGAMLQVDDIVSDIGLNVRYQSITLSGISPEVLQVMRAFEPRLAPVEIHRAAFDPDTHALMEDPIRVFRGWVDDAPFEDEPDGGSSTCRVSLASTARELTRTLATKRSDESYKRRSGDRIFRHGDISQAVQVYWGERREKKEKAAGSGGFNGR